MNKKFFSILIILSLIIGLFLPFMQETKAASQPIADGIYRIKANVGSNKYFDIDAGKKTDGANLQLWDLDSNTDQQKYQIKYSNGYYTITAVHSGKVLDVASQGKSNGTNVWQYASNGTDAQKWTIKDVGNGNYTLISKCNNLAVDVAGGSGTNGANIQMYESNGTAAQKFKFEKVTTSTPSPSPSPSNKEELASGDYMIRVSFANFTLDVQDRSVKDGANIQVWSGGSPTDSSKNNKFHVQKQSDGTYTIRAAHSKKSLDVASQGKSNGTNVWQYSYNGTDAQKWYIKSVGNGLYEVISKCNNLALDIAGGQANIKSGSNVQMYTQNHTAAQRFKFEKAEIKQAVENGSYEIQTAINTNREFDIVDGSTLNGAGIQLWDRVNTANQEKYKIVYDSNKIESANSGKVLDVPSASKKPGTRIQQYDSNNTDAQRWKIIDLKDGTYNIVSECNGLYLTVENSGVPNGTRIKVDNANGSSAQKFVLKETFKVGLNNIEDISQYTEIADYKAQLESIKSRHPNWDINIYYTGLDWNSVIDGEFQMVDSSPRSLTQKGNQWRVDATRYDVSLSWFRASKAAIAYMMDPRNSFEDDYIFQFQDISSSSGTKADIKKMVKGTFIDNDSCIQAILDAAKESNISPFHLASRIIQESGANGSSIMNGYSYGGKTVYNLFNINVSGNGNSGIQNGAKYAYDHGWFSKEASIKGGAAFLRTGYLNRGQTTAYFQKYNVVQLNGLYSNQYMQNIHAANSEGMKIYAGYKSAGLVDSHFSFAIPLYDNMPAGKAARPLE